MSLNVTSIEQVILSNLIEREEFTRKVLPFLKSEYFSSTESKLVFESISEYFNKYNHLPTKTSLQIAIQQNDSLTENLYKKTIEEINTLKSDGEDYTWLVDETEKFCQEKAVYNAIMSSIQILDDEKKQSKFLSLQKSAIPDLLKEALSVSFDTKIGHDFILDYEARHDLYTTKEDRIPFDLEYMNKITGGGVPKKTLNVIMATTNAGKTLFMCHHAAACLRNNLNVLYITAEMAEERIAQRIDANILDCDVNQIEELPKSLYSTKFQKAIKPYTGTLIIKEYPTGTATVNHFRALLKELKIKKSFTPDIIFIDYINICASARLKADGSGNTYTYIKAIAEEFRGLAVEYQVPIFTATQSNRSGHNNSDVDLTNTAESFGLPATADLMIVLMRTDEMDKQNQLLVKQLKNRYNDASLNKRFILGINRTKMKLFDISNPEVGLVKMEDDPDLRGELTSHKLDPENSTKWKPSLPSNYRNPFEEQKKKSRVMKTLDFGGTTDLP